MTFNLFHKAARHCAKIFTPPNGTVNKRVCDRECAAQTAPRIFKHQRIDSLNARKLIYQRVHALPCPGALGPRLQIDTTIRPENDLLSDERHGVTNRNQLATAIAPKTRRIDNCEADQAKHQLKQGFGQRSWRFQQPQSPTDIIRRRSPTPVQEALHRTGAHPHHSHASLARATGSASRGPPPGNRRHFQLVCRLPFRVGGPPAAGGTARSGHMAKGTRSPPTACVRGGGTTPPTPCPASGAR